MLKNDKHVFNRCSYRGTNQWSSNYKSGALPLNYTATLSANQKTLSLVAKHLAHEYQEKTTTCRIFMPFNISSCRVDVDNPKYRHKNQTWFVGLCDLWGLTNCWPCYIPIYINSTSSSIMSWESCHMPVIPLTIMHTQYNLTPWLVTMM